MTTNEILKAARDLIADPGHWTTNFPARNAAGQGVSSSSKDAVKFCAYGAIAHVLGVDELDGPTLQRLSRHAHGVGISIINDCNGHAAILELFDLALADEPDCL